jgi:CheY-like chemotaxis protein
MPNYKILVVDDDETSRRLRQALLTSEGLEVALASSGKECLEMAPQVRPDLILLDVIMPDMNGYAVCEELKRLPDTAEIPVAFMSSLNDRESLLRGYRAGAIDFIEKGTEALLVLARIKALLSMGGLIKDKSNLLKANELMLTKINTLFTEEGAFKKLAMLKDELAGGSEAVFNEIDKLKSMIDNPKALAVLNNVGLSMEFSDWVCWQVNELSKTVNKLQAAIKGDSAANSAIFQASSNSVFMVKKDRSEIENLLSALSA